MAFFNDLCGDSKLVNSNWVEIMNRVLLFLLLSACQGGLLSNKKDAPKEPQQDEEGCKDGTCKIPR